jgi:hypothetical protein
MPTTSQWFAQSGGKLIGDLWVPRQMGIILMTPAFVPNIDTQLRYSDVSAGELPAAGGYVLGGKEILSRSASYDALANEMNLLGDDVVWGPGATFTTRYGCIYEMATADKFLWGLLDFGQDFSVANGYFAVDFAAAALSVAAGPPV